MVIKIENYIVGIDIGGTWIRAAICTIDLREENIKTKMTRMLKENEYSISNTVIILITELMMENNIEKEQLLGILGLTLYLFWGYNESCIPLVKRDLKNSNL